jgi:hypothetical protein
MCFAQCRMRKTLWQDETLICHKSLSKREREREHVIIDYDCRVYQERSDSNMKTSQANAFWL